jgi:hypothetical protein
MWGRRSGTDPQADFACQKGGVASSATGCFAAALAKQRRAELVTGDPEFGKLEDEIAVHWLKNTIRILGVYWSGFLSRPSLFLP